MQTEFEPKLETDFESKLETDAKPELEAQLPKSKVDAILNGELIQAPEDLFIPSDALLVLLESFEGPLDLLLYLIRKHNVDILRINVEVITNQYLTYLNLMQEMNIELAAEYLLMAAILTEIKSSSLLFKPSDLEDEEEEDPKINLIRRLLEYERFKKAAEDLDFLDRCERDFFLPKPQIPTYEEEPVDISLDQLTLALAKVFKRQGFKEEHSVKQEQISINSKMDFVLKRLQSLLDSSENTNTKLQMQELYEPSEGSLGVVTTFMAVLELAKQSLISIEQEYIFAPIYLSAIQVCENSQNLQEVDELN